MLSNNLKSANKRIMGQDDKLNSKESKMQDCSDCSILKYIK